MAHGWDPYLPKYSSLSPDHGTPDSEVNHPHHTGGFIGHDGFATANIPLGASATNTDYCFSNSVGNVDSNWCPEIGNYQKNSLEKTWQPDGEQKDYLNRWENGIPNYETSLSATTGHCSIAPHLGPQQASVMPTGTFNNYANSQGSSDADGEPRSSCGFMTGTSAHSPQSGAAARYHSQWPQKHPEDANNATDDTPNMIWANLTAENATKCVQDLSPKSYECSGISIANSNACTDSERQRKCFEHACKQEEFLNICPKANVSEKYNGDERQTLMNEKETSDTVKGSNLDSAHMVLDGNPNQTSPQTCDIKTENLNVSVTDSCQTLSQSKITIELVNSDFRLIDSRETSDALESNFQGGAAGKADNEKLIETVDGSSSQPVCKIPGASKDPGTDPHLHSSTETSSGEQAVLSTACSPLLLSTTTVDDFLTLSSFSHSVTNVGETSHQSNSLIERTSLMTDSDNKCDDSNNGCIDRKGNEGGCLRSPALKAIDLEEGFPTEKTNASAIADSNDAVNDGGSNVFDSRQTFMVDNKPSKDEQNAFPKFDIGKKEPQFPQNSEEKSSPDKKTPENTSMTMNLIRQTESHLSDQLECSSDAVKMMSCMGFETSTGQSSEEIVQSSPFVYQKTSNSDGQSVYADGEPLSPSSSEENEFAEPDTCEPAVASPKMKPSSEMLKLLQPIVLLKTMDTVDLTMGKYVCSQCLHIASNLDALIEHHNLHHSMHSFQLCLSCGVYLVSQDQLAKHLCGRYSPMFSSNSGKGGKRIGRHCHECGISFSKSNHFISHMRVHTGKTPFKCGKCGLYFAQGSSLRRHKNVSKSCGSQKPVDKKHTPKSHTGTVKLRSDCYVKLFDITKTNVCMLCGKCFKSKMKVKKHYYNVHKKAGTIQPREKPSEIAVEPCSDEYKYKCPLCPQIFSSHLNRNRHLKNCAKDTIVAKSCRVNGRFKCPLCLATFSLSSNRYRHIQTFCLRNFISFLGRDTVKDQKMSRYSNQMATVVKKLKMEEEHLNGKKTENVNNVERKPKYRCNLCPAVFFHQSGKYRHMTKHKLFELTGQRFKYRNSLKKPHLTERPETDTEEKLQNADVPLKKGDRPYHCSQCGKEFKSNINLMQHKITHQRRIQCTVCKRILPTIGELIEHRKSHLNRGLLQCPDCPQKFTFPVYLLRHLHSHMKSQKALLQQEDEHKVSPSSQTLSQAQHSCPLCNEVFDGAELLSKHYLTHPAIQCSDCPFCKRKFTKRRNLTRHMARHVGGKRFFCKCGKRFSTEDNLKVHRETCSSLTDSLVCRYCSRTFVHKVHLYKHYRGHQNKTLTRCPKCDFYYGISKLGKHQKMCNGKAITDRDTSQKTNQRTVLKVPSKEAQYTCPYCPRTFRYRSLYHRHFSTHKNVEVHACILCGQNFHSRLLCSQHEASCEGVYKCEDLSNQKAENLPQRDSNEFKCKFCNKTFTKSRNLRSHILSHNEVKPYRCKVCDSCFSRYDHLKVHVGCCKGKGKGKVKLQLRPQICIPKISLDQVGTGWQKELGLNNEKEQMYECKLCGRNFATQSKLAWHNSMFHTVKRFKCIRCSSFFSHEKTLRSHIKFRKCRLASIVKRKTEKQVANVSSEKHTKILARIQPSSAEQNEGKLLKCNFCPRTFRTSAHLKVHMYLHTAEKSYGCDCGKTFLRKDHLQRHNQTCMRKRNQIPSSGFSCAYCSSRFLLFSQLQEHFLNAHKLETMDEPLNTAPLQQHLSNIQTFEDTSEASKLNRPIDGEAWQTAHKLKESPFCCSICSKGYWNKTLLRNHFRKCKKQVSNTNHLVEGDMPLRADIEMVLADSPAEHSSEEELEDPEPEIKSSVEKKAVVYQCSECDQSFTDGLMLISHLEDHGREEQEKRLNKCSKCGKTFSSHARLEKHMKAHESGMLVCADCSAEFPSKTEFDLHKKQYHDPSHPYSCRLCNFRFKSRVSLCDHCTKEHPEDIFSCTLCERNYTLRASLVRHMNRSHGQEQKNEAEKTLSIQSTSESEANDNDNEDNDDSDDSDDSDESGSGDSDSAPYFPCHVCGKTFTTSENLEDHQRCHLGEKPFECAECGQCFFQSAQLQQHERKHNSEFQCRVCGRGFVSLFALRKHKHTSGKKRPFPCRKCQLYFTSLAQLAEHKLSHPNESFPCDICNRVFPSKSSRAEHRKFHLPKPSGIKLSDQTAVVADKKAASLAMAPTNEFKYRCGVCCVRFRNPEELSEHGCLAGAERQYSCMDCDKHFLHSSHLKKHLSTHKQSSLSKYFCSHCNNSFSSPHDFLNHLRNHDETLRYGQQGFVCPVCHQCFTSPAELVFHFPTHPSETFACKICNKTFLTSSKLKEHEICHTKDTKCKKCGQSFVGGIHDCSQKNLKLSYGDDDEIDVTGEDLCCCPFCPMQFSSKSHLLEHQNRQHPNEKSFTCEICARTYAKQMYLDKHIKKHHRNEPGQSTSQIKFQCAQCHSEFNTAKDLSLHLKLHAAEKEVGKFRCDMCYKSFSHLSLLRRHQESHVGQVVYECTECDKAFAFPHLLEAHQQSHV